MQCLFIFSILYFCVRIMLHCLAIPFSQAYFIKSVCYSISDDYDVNADKIWMNRDWYYTTAYGNLFDDGKATESLLPENLKQWIITQPKYFTRKDIEKVRKSMWACIYLVLTTQIQARSSKVDN